MKNSVQFIFNNEAAFNGWFPNRFSAYCEMGNLRLVVGGDMPCITYVFGGENVFDTAKVKYFAAYYKIESTISRSFFFLSTDLHPKFADAGHMEFDLKKGGWRGHIIDLSENPFWEGTVKGFRWDVIKGQDINADILIERLGFFATEEEAQAFLDEADPSPDYSMPVTLRRKLQTVTIPGGTLSDGYDYSDYLIGDVSCASGDSYVTFTDKSGVTTPVLSYTNKLGHSIYTAKKAGIYELKNYETPFEDVKNHPDRKSIDFVCARGLFLGTSETQFSPDSAMTGDMLNHFINVLTEKQAVTLPLCEAPITRPEMIKAVEKCGIQLPDCLKVSDGSKFTRADAACLARDIVKVMMGVPVKYNSRFDKERIMIGGWANFRAGITDEAIKTFTEAGLDFIVANGEYDGYPDKKNILDYADKYGAQVTFLNYPTMCFENEKDIPFDDAEIYEHPCFYGHHMIDEPGSDQFPELGMIARQYIKRYPGKVPFFNMLPMYANAAQLKYGAGAASIEYYDSDKDLYRKYLEAYVKYIPTNYICVDVYPMKGSKTIYAGYCRNLDIFGSVCRENDRDFWLYVQTVGLDYRDIPDESAMRWQMYCGLSFGVKTFIHFTYGSYNQFFGYEWSYSMVNDDGTPTPLYYDAKTASMEMHAISDVYMQYKNLGAFNVNADKAKYLELEKPYSFDFIKSVDTQSPVLVGCFDKKSGGGKAFTLVNMENIFTDKSAKVSFEVAKPSTLTAYFKGVPTVLTPDANGTYTVELENGQGVFITAQ